MNDPSGTWNNALRSKNRCVVTGIGLLCPIAVSFEAFVSAIKSGQCSADERYPVEVKGLEKQSVGRVPDQAISDGEQSMGRFYRLGLSTILRALENARYDFAVDTAARKLMLLGTTLGPTDSIESTVNQRATGHLPASERVRQHWVCSAIHTFAKRVGFSGEAHTLTQGCSSSNYALSFASDTIRQGKYDIALVGGIDVLSRVAMVVYGRFGILGDRPRPFDADRKGLVMAEGAGMFLLESEAHAIERGADIYAEVAGGHSTAEGYHMLAPRPDGDSMFRAMAGALKKSDVQPEQVDYISAAASGTAGGDIAEVRAIKRLFEHTGRIPPVSATKSQLGHTHAASGVIEAAACVAAIREGVLPPTVSVELQDPECTFDIVANQSRKERVDIALNNSSAFGGVDSSVVLRRYVAEP